MVAALLHCVPANRTSPEKAERWADVDSAAQVTFALEQIWSSRRRQSMKRRNSVARGDEGDRARRKSLLLRCRSSKRRRSASRTTCARTSCKACSPTRIDSASTQSAQRRHCKTGGWRLSSEQERWGQRVRSRFWQSEGGELAKVSPVPLGIEAQSEGPV